MYIRYLCKDDLLSDFENFRRLMSGLTDVESLTLDRSIDILKQNNKHIVVAIAGGRIIGTGALLVDVKFGHYPDNRVGFVEDIVVLPEWQHQGIGSAIVTHLIGCAEIAKCYKLLLTCSDDKSKFYSKFGFKQKDNLMRLDLR
jgi:glucosamine-phosphate N-acetyltransferase